MEFKLIDFIEHALNLLILFLQSPAPLLGKGSIKKEQPPHSSCSLIPKGFHYIYFIPYI